MKENNKDGCLAAIFLGLTFLTGINVGGIINDITHDRLPKEEDLMYLQKNKSITEYYKNPVDGRIVRAWRATANGERLINVTSLDVYWKGIADEVLETKCGDLKELYSVSELEKVYLIDNSVCLGD